MASSRARRPELEYADCRGSYPGQSGRPGFVVAVLGLALRRLLGGSGRKPCACRCLVSFVQLPQGPPHFGRVARILARSRIIGDANASSDRRTQPYWPDAGLSLSDPDDESKLVSRLMALAERTHKRLTVVFDPNPLDKTPSIGHGRSQHGNVTVLFAPSGSKADDVIRHMVAV